MLSIFIWFQVQPKLFALFLKICLFGKTIGIYKHPRPLDPFYPTKLEKNHIENIQPLHHEAVSLKLSTPGPRAD